MIIFRRANLFVFLLFLLFFSQKSFSEDQNVLEVLEIIQKDLKTLEKAVYSASNSESLNNTDIIDQNTEDVLTRHLLKLSELENQFNILNNKFEEVNFKLDKLSSRLSKIQADNQLRFQELEERKSAGSLENKDLVSKPKKVEEKILPDETPEKQYEFASSFLKVGDYNTAERAFLEFVKLNPDHNLAGNAQYWYAETFRIRQLYTDAAEAYLEGYQKYPKSSKAPINLLKLGVSLVQIGEKDQGCLMISGVKEQYPKANQSVLQKAKYEEKKFGCKKNNT